MQDPPTPASDDNVFMDIKKPNTSLPNATSRPMLPNQNPAQVDPMISAQPPVPVPTPAAPPTPTPSAPAATFSNSEPISTPSISNDDSLATAPQPPPPSAPSSQPAPTPVPNAPAPTEPHNQKKSNLLRDFMVVVALLIIVGALVYIIKYKSSSL